MFASPWAMWIGVLAIILHAAFVRPVSAQSATAHYAANHNFDDKGYFTPLDSGFNLADVSVSSQLSLLPDGVRALVWIGRCDGADHAFTHLVSSFSDSSKVFGFYLMDDPDPTGQYSERCTAEHLREEADWIHSVAPRAQTFVMLMNMGPSRQQPRFDSAYRPEATHIDLFGVSPYPCRSELSGCDFRIIADYVAAAEAGGFPRQRLVPAYQTFGGGLWRDDSGGSYRLPSAELMQELLERWDRLLVHPAFDYAYSWGIQRGDAALENSPELRQMMLFHNSRPPADGH
jgi:hypothetical protein